MARRRVGRRPDLSERPSPGAIPRARRGARGNGKAYRCYCTIEELEAERAAAEASGETIGMPDAAVTRAEAAPAAAGLRRPRHPLRGRAGPIEFHDLIRGDVQFDGDLIDDFVLLRSDGNPTYHLSVVVDDIDMDITHVARGDDHLSNTPKHILLFRAFGAEVPSFAHLPLILGSDKKRLSKRTGATSAEEYRDMGIVPEALFNFLTLLGWNPVATASSSRPMRPQTSSTSATSTKRRPSSIPRSCSG